VLPQSAVAHIERFVIHQEAKELAVRDVDYRLAFLRIPIPSFCVRERKGFEESIEVGAWRVVWFALIEVPTQADVPVRKREDGLGLAEEFEMKLPFSN